MTVSSSGWGIRNLILNTSQPIQELGLSYLTEESRKMGEDRRILIPKEKEVGRGKQCTGNLAKQTVVSGRGPSHSEDLDSKNPHYKKSKS